MEKRKHITVVAAVIEWNGRVLCMQRGATPFSYTAYHWEFPGGKIEQGETPEQALAREILEEMDLRVRVGEHITTVDHSYPDFDITLMFYRCIALNGGNDGAPSFTRREHHDHRWLLPGELAMLDWCPADAPVISILMQQ